MHENLADPVALSFTNTTRIRVRQHSILRSRGVLEFKGFVKGSEAYESGAAITIDELHEMAAMCLDAAAKLMLAAPDEDED